MTRSQRRPLAWTVRTRYRVRRFRAAERVGPRWHAIECPPPPGPPTLTR